MVHNPSPEYVKTTEAARIAGISAAYLKKLRLHNPSRSPPFFKIGRAVRYKPEDVRAWMEAHLQNAPMVGGRR